MLSAKTPTPRSIFSDSSDEEERLYFQMIDAAVEAGEDKVISNGKPAHAVYLLNKLIASATETVRIYTGRLARTFDGVCAYGDPMLAQSAISFLGNNHAKLSIIIADDPDIDAGQSIEAHPFLAEISRADINGELKVLKHDTSKRAPFEYHFLVTDEKALRIEVDPAKAQAYANFGDAKLGKTFADLFDFIQAESKQLIPVPHAP